MMNKTLFLFLVLQQTKPLWLKSTVWFIEFAMCYAHNVALVSN